MSKEETPVQQTIDFSAIIDMVDEWCRLTNVDPFDFIDFYQEVKENEIHEEIDEQIYHQLYNPIINGCSTSIC